MSIPSSARYANEQAPSSWPYPAEFYTEYQARKSIRWQVEALRKHFPKLNIAWAVESGQAWYDSLQLPNWVEGPLAYIRWEAFGGYTAALEQLLEKIAATRRLHNYRAGKLDPEYLQQVEQTIEAERALAALQPGDVLVVPSQAGFRHRGKSSRRAVETFAAGEFGLGAVAEGCRALICPKRYVRYEQLHTHLPGDKYAPDADGDFYRVPCFNFGEGKLRFSTVSVNYLDVVYGSSSGFLPQ